MCPACVASAGLIAGSVMSTGVFAALAAKVFRSRKNAKSDVPNIQTEGRDDNGYRNEQEQAFESGTAC